MKAGGRGDRSTILLESFHSGDGLGIQLSSSGMLGGAFTRWMVVRKVLAINAPSQQPRRLVLKPKDAKLAAALAGLGLTLALISRYLLLVGSSSITYQEHLLQSPVVSLRSSDDERVAVGKRVCLCSSEEGFERRVAAPWWGREHVALHDWGTHRRRLIDHGIVGSAHELLADG
jgi:hypothetical protein